MNPVLFIIILCSSCVFSIAQAQPNPALPEEDFLFSFRDSLLSEEGFKATVNQIRAIKNPHLRKASYKRVIAFVEAEFPDYPTERVKTLYGLELKRSGEYVAASKLFLGALTGYKKAQNVIGTAVIYEHLGQVQVAQRNYDSAHEYYDSAIRLFTEKADTIRLATTLLSKGYGYYLADQPTLALKYLEQSKNIAAEKDQLLLLGYAQGNIGLVYSKLDQPAIAELHLKIAIDHLRQIEDWYAIAEYEGEIARLYLERNQFSFALKHAVKSDSLASAYGYMKMARDVRKTLAEIFAAQGEYAKAYQYQLAYTQLNDSILNETTIQKVANLQLEHKLGLKEARISTLEKEKYLQQWLLIGMAAIILLLTVIAILLHQRKKEKQKAEELLKIKEKLLQRSLQKAVSGSF